MAKLEKTQPRPWEFDDLLALGKRGGVTYLKAIPVLILDEWVKQEQGAQVYIRTKALVRRLVESGLHRPFKSKGTSNILAALSSIQNDRNLTKPPLMKTKMLGGYWVNVEDYKHLLEEFRQYYAKQYPGDYKKLFPEGAPQWESLIIRKEPKETRTAFEKLEVQDETQNLLAPVAKVLRDQQKAITELTELNKTLQAELLTSQTSLQEKRQVPRHIIIDNELKGDCEKLLGDKDTYIDAIRRAGVVLEERLRTTLGGEGLGKYGVDLVDEAFKKSFGKLIISDHPAEQEGVQMLFRGAVQFVRNPPAHKKMQYTELEAWQTISLIDYLLLLLRQAKRRET
jgi:uncharacterized protein (TIGR02391 family)